MINNTEFTKYQIIKSLININYFLTYENQKLYNKSIKKRFSFVKKIIDYKDSRYKYDINGELLKLNEIHEYSKSILSKCNEYKNDTIELNKAETNIINHFNYIDY